MSNPSVNFLTFFDASPATSAAGGLPQFKFNEIYSIDEQNEASLYDSINCEFTYHHGTDVIWLEREVNTAEPIFGEYLYKKIQKGTPLRLFVEETDAWGGAGDMYTKFGLQINDECTLHCPKRTFAQARNNAVSGALYPQYNDLVYIPKAKKLFEVIHIEDETAPAFYLFGNRSAYKISCKAYVYDHSEIDSSNDNGIPAEIEALDKQIIVADEIWNVSPTATEVNSENNLEVNTYEITGVTNSIVDTTEVDPLTL
jgi:hypothetical protein